MMLRYRLRTLLIFTTLLACGLGAYARAQAIERDKVQRVERFNQAMDKQQFELASDIADESLEDYPSESVFQNMKWKVDYALRIMNGEGIEVGCF